MQLIDPLKINRIMTLSLQYTLISISQPMLQPRPKALHNIPRPIPISATQIGPIRRISPLHCNRLNLNSTVYMERTASPRAKHNKRNLSYQVNILLSHLRSNKGNNLTEHLILMSIIPRKSSPNIPITKHARNSHTRQ